MDDIIGLKIVDVRMMTNRELALEGWSEELSPHEEPTAIVLEDGQVLYPSRDDEGNGPGAIFGCDDDVCFRVSHPISENHKKLQKSWEEIQNNFAPIKNES